MVAEPTFGLLRVEQGAYACGLPYSAGCVVQSAGCNSSGRLGKAQAQPSVTTLADGQ